MVPPGLLFLSIVTFFLQVKLSSVLVLYFPLYCDNLVIFQGESFCVLFSFPPSPPSFFRVPMAFFVFCLFVFGAFFFFPEQCQFVAFIFFFSCGKCFHFQHCLRYLSNSFGGLCAAFIVIFFPSYNSCMNSICWYVLYSMLTKNLVVFHF